VRRQIRQGFGGRALLDAALARMAMSEQFASVGQLLDRLDGGGTPPPEKKKAVELTPNLDMAPPPSPQTPPPPPPRARPVPVVAIAEAVAVDPPAATNKITAEVVAQLDKDPLIGLIMRELGGRPIKVE